MTDSKAVKGSSSSLDSSLSVVVGGGEGGANTSLLVVVAGVGCGVLLTSLIVCLLVTCQRRVRERRSRRKLHIHSYRSFPASSPFRSLAAILHGQVAERGRG